MHILRLNVETLNLKYQCGLRAQHLKTGTLIIKQL